MDSEDPIRLPVSSPGGQYDVIVGRNLLGRVRELANIDRQIAVITDSHVGPLYAANLGRDTAVITIPAGEKSKTLTSVREIYDQLLLHGLDRYGVIVGLGGGVVGDIAGFVAATYMRGVDFIQCPTTVLAMVDASVGGKTGVDLSQGKNLVGAFKQPIAVVADIATLRTLPTEEFRCGLAEIIKHGLIADPELFKSLATARLNGDHRLNSDLQSLLVSAIDVKREIVQGDPFEQGRRAVLNLGHTFGHALEQVSGYTIRHGEGVAMGLVAAANLSARLGYCSPVLQNQIEKLLRHFNLPIRMPPHLSAATLYQAMGSDKKKAQGRLRFVLLRGVGDVFIAADVPETAVLATLKDLS